MHTTQHFHTRSRTHTVHSLRELLNKHGEEAPAIDLSPKVEIAPVVIPPGMPLQFIYSIMQEQVGRIYCIYRLLCVGGCCGEPPTHTQSHASTHSHTCTHTRTSTHMHTSTRIHTQSRAPGSQLRARHQAARPPGGNRHPVSDLTVQHVHLNQV